MTLRLFIPALAAAAALGACGASTPPASEPASSDGATTYPGQAMSAPYVTETAGSKARCTQSASVISDGEDGTNRSNVVEGRGGYWYTYTEKQGTKVTPAPGDQGGTFTMTPGGANGTKFAAHMSGELAKVQDVYAGMGLGFVNPKGEYDASRYGGISFWGKKSPESTTNVRMKLPDHATEPAGGVCTECFNDFGEYIEFTNEWKKYTFDFATMKQQSDWGKPRPESIATNALYGIQFQVDDFGRKFEIWVDELEFTVCP
jgi:endoglucanase